MCLNPESAVHPTHQYSNGYVLYNTLQCLDKYFIVSYITKERTMGAYVSPKTDQVNIIKPALSFREWIGFSLLFSTSRPLAPTVEYSHNPLFLPTPFHSCGSHKCCYVFSAPPIWALLTSPRIDSWTSWTSEWISFGCLDLEPERESRHSVFRG